MVREGLFKSARALIERMGNLFQLYELKQLLSIHH